ncbi:MAG: hypothetical protein IPP49_02090 [Saprospiraceae bacterium]|nr:hypothetical protein [Saprospiraceae bacterium]
MIGCLFILSAIIGRKLYTVKQLKNGDIICTGKYTTKASTPRIEGSPYMIRLDKDGILIWGVAYVERSVPDGKIKVVLCGM